MCKQRGYRFEGQTSIMTFFQQKHQFFKFHYFQIKYLLPLYSLCPNVPIDLESSYTYQNFLIDLAFQALSNVVPIERSKSKKVGMCQRCAKGVL